MEYIPKDIIYHIISYIDDCYSLNSLKSTCKRFNNLQINVNNECQKYKRCQCQISPNVQKLSIMPYDDKNETMEYCWKRISKLSQLQELTIINIYAGNFDYLRSMNNLKTLNLIGIQRMNHITSLRKLHQLESLSIVRTLIETLQGIDKLTNLTSLYIDDCSMMHRSLDEFHYISRLYKLKKLNLTCCELQTFKHIAKCYSLESLTVNVSTKLNDYHLLRFLSNLKSLVFIGGGQSEKRKFNESNVAALLPNCRINWICY